MTVTDDQKKARARTRRPRGGANLNTRHGEDWWGVMHGTIITSTPWLVGVTGWDGGSAFVSS